MRMRFVLSLLLSAALYGCTDPSVSHVCTSLHDKRSEKLRVDVTGRADDPDCEVVMSEYLQKMDGFGYSITAREANILSHLPSARVDRVVRDLHVGGGAGIIHLAIKASGYERYVDGEIDRDIAWRSIYASVAADSLSFSPYLRKVISLTGDKLIWAMPVREPSDGRPVATVSREESMRLYCDYLRLFAGNMLDAGLRIDMTSPHDGLNIVRAPLTDERHAVRFLGRYLGPGMYDLGARICLGNISSSVPYDLDEIFGDPAAAGYIYSVSFYDSRNCRWIIDACKKHGIRHLIAKQHTDADGMFGSWEQIRRMISEGATGYIFSNLSDTTATGNSIIAVDDHGNVTYKRDYYILKHISNDVVPGAIRIKTRGRFDDLLAFMNRDNSVVIIAANRSQESIRPVINIGEHALRPILPPGSLNTIVVRGDNGFFE